MPTLFDGQGHRLDLGPRLGRGGEGEVFDVAGQPHAAAKVLYAGRTQGKAEKLEAMVRSPPAGAYGSIDGFPVLTWPRGLLYATPTPRASSMQGYTMAKVRPGDFVPFYQLTASGRRDGLGGQPMTWDRLVLLAQRLCHVVRTLHRFGYAVGDLNDRNVLVSRRLTPLLMDTDSFQVPNQSPRSKGPKHYPSIVGDAQYWPPELLDVDLTRHTGDRRQGDLHALGVLLFQLFMDGYRPYQATGSAVARLETLHEKTKAGHYPWASPRRGVLQPPSGAPDYQALPKPIRRLFERCFVDGHRRPKHRPTADEWHDALRQLQAEGFQSCPRTARHSFGRRERSCPWCGDANDRFAAPAPRAVARARPAPRAVPPMATLRHKPAASRPTPRAKPAGKRGPPQRPLQAPTKPMATLVAKPAAPAPKARAAKARATVRAPARRPAKRRARAAQRAARRGRARWVAYAMMATFAGLLALSAF